MYGQRWGCQWRCWIRASLSGNQWKKWFHPGSISTDHRAKPFTKDRSWRHPSDKVAPFPSHYSHSRREDGTIKSWSPDQFYCFNNLFPADIWIPEALHYPSPTRWKEQDPAARARSSNAGNQGLLAFQWHIINWDFSLLNMIKPG